MFTNLHVHSVFSLLDSIARVEDIVDFEKKNEQGAVCISDHGNLSAMIMTHEISRKEKVKCITACEIYEVDNDQEKADKKDYKQPRYHLLLIAKNNIGLHNLIEIVSFANTEGKYKKPLISIERIKENNWGEGIICCTACQAGRLSKYLVENKYEQAVNFMYNLDHVFDNVYCEIQSHDTEDQAKANKLIYDFSLEEGYKYVITTDAHMINSKDKKYHGMFVEVGEGRETGEFYTDCYMQTEEDVYKTLAPQFLKGVIKKGIEATQEIVNMCEVVDVGLDNKPQMPHIDVPVEFSNSTEYLKYLCYKSFNERFGHMSEEEKQKRRDRIDIEIPVLEQLDFVDYLIMLNMISVECKNRGIPLGYSRGSGGNCLCLYMLNVTQIDSVRWDLDFSRFANLGRKGTLADFDFDVDKNRRGEMIQVLKDLFGEDNVCNISTFNTFTNKVAVRDIGKVLNEKEDSPYRGKIPNEIRDYVAKIIPVVKYKNELGEEIEKDILLKEAIESSTDLQKINKEFPLWLDYAIHLGGLPKSRGTHASALMVTPKPIKEYCSICYTQDGEIMYEAEMKSLMDDIKLIKMDILGLKNISVVDLTLSFAGLKWEDVDINHLDLEDKSVYENVFKVGETIGVFQMESAEARRMLIEAKADNIEDIIVVNSANRPGTKDSFPTYCYNKLYPENVEVIHDDLKILFKQSHAVLLYQEQALALLRYAGFPEIEVETGRKAIGKKKSDVMNKLKEKFVKGLEDQLWEDDEIEAMWVTLAKQAEYCFNRGHACAYSLLSYLTAWLKVHYPIEYITSCLIMDNGTEKIPTLLNEAQRLGFQLSVPNINESDLSYTPDKVNNKIMIGIGAIKGLSQKGIQTIIDNRPFVSLSDFMKTALKMNKGDVIPLIKAGVLNELTSKTKMEIFEEYFMVRFLNGKETDYKPIKNINNNHIQELFDSGLIKPEQRDDKDTCTQILNENRRKLGWSDFQLKKLNGSELDWEMEVLNTHLSGDPFEGVYVPDWEKVEPEDEGWIGGVIINVKVNNVKNGKNKGKKMAFLNIDTNGNTADITVFSNKYTEYIDILKNGKCVVCKVKKDKGYKGILQSVELLETYLKRTDYMQKEHRRESNG